VRTLLREEFARAFARVDVLVGPTSPVSAFAIGERIADPVAMYRCDVFSTPANLAGLPGVSVPCGFTTDGLPVGLQVLGPVLGEGRVLRAAAACETLLGAATREPLP
jgi:aspartyl-tRNA(Asn)/glutamyl-tRNA(Gln) amidotransferase subunit A